jgi:hypothetical protein
MAVPGLLHSMKNKGRATRKIVLRQHRPDVRQVLKKSRKYMKFMRAREILDCERGFSNTGVLSALVAQCNLSTLKLLLTLT